MSLLSRGLGPGSLTKAPRPLPGRPCPAQGGPRQGESGGPRPGREAGGSRGKPGVSAAARGEGKGR